MLRRDYVNAIVATTASVLLLFGCASSVDAATPDLNMESMAAASITAAKANRANEPNGWLANEQPGAAISSIIQHPIRLAAAYSPVAVWRPHYVAENPNTLPDRVTAQATLPSYIDTILMILFSASLIAYPLVRKQRALLRSAVTDL